LAVANGTPASAGTNSVAAEQYRDYSVEKNPQPFDRVAEFYRKNHSQQTFDFVKKCREDYCKLNRKEMSILEAIELLEEIIDESDPDTNSPQIVHALQTAEAARKKFPDPKFDWFWCASFVHDLGKVLAHPKFGSLPQWAVVGDTFPVGCAFSDKCVYPEFFAANADTKHAVYSTVLGVYKEHCGLDQVTMSWGHDEYLYWVCVGNKCTLPEEALYVIRYHSFYPWHTGGAYTQLTNEKDKKMLEWVQVFQHCDLYSKSDNPADMPDVKTLRPFYEQLCKKYFPDIIRW